MQSTRTRTLVTLATLIVSFIITTAPTFAALWTGGDGNWAVDGNWNSANYPNDSATTATVDGPRTVTLDDNVTVNRLYTDFSSNPGGDFNLVQSASETLTLDGTSPMIDVYTNFDNRTNLWEPVINVPVVFDNQDGMDAATIQSVRGGAGGGRVPMTFQQDVTVKRDLNFDVDDYQSGITINGDLTVSGTVTVDTGHAAARLALNGGDNDFTNLTINSGGVSIPDLPSNLTDLNISGGGLTATALPSGLEPTIDGTLARTSGQTGDWTFNRIDGSGKINVGWNTRPSSVTLHVASGTQNLNIAFAGTNLNKTGAGTVWMNNLNGDDWDAAAGGTNIQEGTWIVNTNNITGRNTFSVSSGATLGIADGITLAPDSAVTFSAGSTLAGSGTYDAPDGDFDAPDNFTIAPGLSTGNLTVDIGVGNTLTLTDTSSLNFELDPAGNDTLSVVGDLDLGGSTLNLSGFPDTGTWYTIISADNLAGSFGSITEGYDTRFQGGNFQVSIPEPTTALLLALGGLVLCRSRRRK